MAKKILMSGVLGAVVFFIVSAALHMSPLGGAGIRNLPGESAIVPAMKGAITEPGFYFFPGMAGKDEASQKAWEEKLHAGPYGILIYSPGPGAAMNPWQLIGEFASNVVEMLIAAYLLSLAAARVGYGGRVLFVVLVVLVGTSGVMMSFGIWFKFPWEYVGASILIEVVCAVAAGLVMARIQKPELLAA